MLSGVEGGDTELIGRRWTIQRFEAFKTFQRRSGPAPYRSLTALINFKPEGTTAASRRATQADIDWMIEQARGP